MKTNKDFRLSKESKRMLTHLHGEKYTHWKKMMIDAEVSETKAKLSKIKERSTTNQGEA
jgi:hypothetical protein